jgi:hypothetical protein
MGNESKHHLSREQLRQTRPPMAFQSPANLEVRMALGDDHDHA